jgi:hypothetical protein
MTDRSDYALFVSFFACPSFHIMISILETGNWKLETGNWKLETGNWKLETVVAAAKGRRNR